MRLLAILAVALLSACASLQEGSGLVPGTSTAADVQAAMGQPAQTLSVAGGLTALYYPLLPEGRRTYVAMIGADGRLKALEQRLVPQELAKVAPGMTADQVRELLGPPGKVVHYRFKNQDVWEYKWLAAEDRRVFWVGFTPDGKVAEVYNIHDYESDPPSGPTKD
jgi:hypothetical protein